MGQLAKSNISEIAKFEQREAERLVDWFHNHPDTVRGDANRLIARAERAVRAHAYEDAWTEARDYIEERMHQWERSWGFHASDAYVALEVCPKLARALRTHERHMSPEDAEHLIGPRLMAMFDDDGRNTLAEWAGLLGEQEHHRVWEEIIRYTRKRGRDLVRAGKLSRDLDWETTENFAAKAAMIAAMLVSEYEARARSGSMKTIR